MEHKYPIYKGLQKPLTYKGFQGKFIAWGIASLVAGLVLGAVVGSLTSMVLGGVITLATITGGLLFTSRQQKKGLHSKTRHSGVFRHRTNLTFNHVQKKKYGL
jgi:hypothetical protein